MLLGYPRKRMMDPPTPSVSSSRAFPRGRQYSRLVTMPGWGTG